MFLLLLLLPLLLLLLLLLRMPLECFPEVPSGFQRLPEASRDQRFPEALRDLIEFLLERSHFWAWLAGEGCSLEASLSPDENHFHHFYAFLWDCRVFTASLVAPLAFSMEYGLSLNRKIFASSTVWSAVNSQCVSCNMDVHRHLVRDAHQQHSCGYVITQRMQLPTHGRSDRV